MSIPNPQDWSESARGPVPQLWNGFWWCSVPAICTTAADIQRPPQTPYRIDTIRMEIEEVEDE